MENKQLKIGDEVLLEQCWEDESGQYHDEYVIISRILPDGQLKFRIGHWKERKQKEQKLQAYLNKCEWYEKDVQKTK
jgi:hypothetical protein